MSEELAWHRPLNSGYILLGNDAEQKMRKYRQVKSSSKEAGGVILGYRRGEHIEITDITVPYPHDKRKRTYFDRCDRRHQYYAFKKWLGSLRQVGYLGEWHTHPEKIPSPSRLDMNEWGTLLRKNNAPLVFMIAGISQLWVGCSEKSVITEVTSVA